MTLVCVNSRARSLSLFIFFLFFFYFVFFFLFFNARANAGETTVANVLRVTERETYATVSCVWNNVFFSIGQKCRERINDEQRREGHTRARCVCVCV